MPCVFLSPPSPEIAAAASKTVAAIFYKERVMEMSKFNEKNSIKTVNESGNAAYSMQPKEKLLTQVLSTMVAEPKFYGDNTPEMVSLAEEIAQKDGRFIANLGLYARHEMNMRSVSHVLMAVLSNKVKGEEYVRQAIAKSVVRGDDVTEILSAYTKMYGKPVPNSLRKGLRDAVEKMDGFQLAKYSSDKKAVKMADVVKLVHPDPNGDTERSQLYKDCIEGKLRMPESWETNVSAAGNTAETWEKLITENKLGYMAGLRNLRNIVKSGASNIDMLLDKLADPEAVLKSRQLPFRFLSAWRNLPIETSSKVFDALASAVDAAVENYPRLQGKTAIFVDSSGSMNAQLSRGSWVSVSDVATMLAISIARLSDDFIILEFDDRVKRVVLSGREHMMQAFGLFSSCGGATYMNLPFEELVNKKIDVDRIIVLSDTEVNNPYFRSCPIQKLADEYRKSIGHDVWVHAWDLQGYGTQQFMGAKTNLISGWSEKGINFISEVENGSSTMLEAIEQGDFPQAVLKY